MVLKDEVHQLPIWPLLERMLVLIYGDGRWTSRMFESVCPSLTTSQQDHRTILVNGFLAHTALCNVFEDFDDIMPVQITGNKPGPNSVEYLCNDPYALGRTHRITSTRSVSYLKDSEFKNANYRGLQSSQHLYTS